MSKNIISDTSAATLKDEEFVCTRDHGQSISVCVVCVHGIAFICLCATPQSIERSNCGIKDLCQEVACQVFSVQPRLLHLKTTGRDGSKC